jgi:Tfp pilus assembly protein FimV
VRSPRPGPARLTHRGRLVVVVAALLVAFAVGVFVTAAGSVATQQPGTPAPTKIVQVHSGDTLWEIASGLADDGDVRAMMVKIEQLNALDSADLQAGQRLVVPAG